MRGQDKSTRFLANGKSIIKKKEEINKQDKIQSNASRCSKF